MVRARAAVSSEARGRTRGLYEAPGKKVVKPATGNTTKPKTGTSTKPTAPDNSAQMEDAMSLADDARQAGRNEAAERGYQLASKLMPSDPRPYLGLGHIYYDQKNTSMPNASTRARRRWPAATVKRTRVWPSLMPR